MAKYDGGAVSSTDRGHEGAKEKAYKDKLGKTASGNGELMRQAYAAYKEANQPQTAMTRRRVDNRATHKLPDGTSKKKNKPAAVVMTRERIPNPNTATGTARPTQSRVNPAGSPTNTQYGAASGWRMPTKAAVPGERKNSFQKGRSNKIK